MTTLIAGQRMPLSQINVSEGTAVSLKFSLLSPFDMDISCFALDAAGKLISDDYMVFYNQPSSPCGNIKNTVYTNSVSGVKGLQAEFEVQLSKLPASIDSLFFVLSSDVALNQVQSLKLTVDQQGYKADASYKGSDFEQTQASMLIQLYKKGGVWRVANIAQGFNGGLAAIVRHFGGDVDDNQDVSARDTTSENTSKVSLEKIVSEKAPKLINLAKKATVSLEKHKLQNVVAKVALVLDATGSMSGQYNKGHVQEVVNRLLPIGISLDDDQSVDCWAFGMKPQHLGTIDLNNYEEYIKDTKGGWRSWDCGTRRNNEPAAIDAVIDFYKKDGLDTPVYVLFISDGGVNDTRGITKSIVEAAKLPIFWQFVGIGGTDYGILRKLDDMSGRVIDNCNFFEMDNIYSLSEEQLYENMLEEFPSWLKEARSIGLINP